MSERLIPRSEHPRPDFMRGDYVCLNGEWLFAFDDADEGLRAGWQKPGFPLPLKIQVPFSYQTKMSGLGPDDTIHPVLWYRRAFTVPQEMAGRHVLLRFGAVDFRCDVYVNGQLAGSHKGGYTPFRFDITGLLQEGENDLCLRVEDEPDVTQPRGKQYWQRGVMGCWYTPVSGIWQTVWLESVGQAELRRVHVTPDVDAHRIDTEIVLERPPQKELTLELAVSLDGQPWKTVTATTRDRVTRVPVDMIAGRSLGPTRLWSPDSPCLYDLKVRVLDGDTEEDAVTTYFGMRKVEVRDGRVYLNNNPIYQRLILDQGYWPDSLLTPPSDEALRQDIRFTLDFGYNGARKHQKVEDPRYYYWADKMGLLVWGEVPSGYDFSEDEVANLAETLAAFIDRDFNHPCIINWVPLNESWGVPNIYSDRRQQALARMLYQLTKTLDGTRLCSVNDGWEQVETDICALHDYADTGEKIAAHFADRKTVETHACDWRPCYAKGVTPTGGEAFLVTEYGGIAFQNIGLQGEVGGMETWGYHDKVTDEDAFFARFQAVTDAVRDIPYCQGYCYTQLTDVMQEINGLLTPDRQPKINVKRFAAINVNPGDRTNQLS